MITVFQDVDNLYIVKTEWIKDGVIKGNAGSYTLIPIASTVAEEFRRRWKVRFAQVYLLKLFSK